MCDGKEGDGSTDRGLVQNELPSYGGLKDSEELPSQREMTRDERDCIETSLLRWFVHPDNQDFPLV